MKKIINYPDYLNEEQSKLSKSKLEGFILMGHYFKRDNEHKYIPGLFYGVVEDFYEFGQLIKKYIEPKVDTNQEDIDFFTFSDFSHDNSDYLVDGFFKVIPRDGQFKQIGVFQLELANPILATEELKNVFVNAVELLGKGHRRYSPDITYLIQSIKNNPLRIGNYDLDKAREISKKLGWSEEKFKKIRGASKVGGFWAKF